MVKFRKSLDSLAGKLIISISILMMAGSALFGYAFITFESETMIKDLSYHASFSADLVKGGLFYSMLTAQRQVIEQTINVLGTAEDVRGIMITDNLGNIVYASDKTKVGGKIDMDSAMQQAGTPRMLEGADGLNELRLTTPIYNERPCYTAQCHFHTEEQSLLGILDMGFSASKLQEARRKSVIATLFFVGLFVACLSVFLCMILYQFVSKPVTLMEEGMKRLSKGDFDHPIEVHTKDEMGLLAGTFNEMAQDIKRYRQYMEDWTKALQEEVEKKTAEIMKAQEQMMDAEKLASLGRMAAGIAHEINSPLTGIVTFSHLLKDRMPPERKQEIEDIDVIIEQAERCSKIIKGLLGFARKSMFEKIETNLNELIESTIFMIKNQAEFHNVQMQLKLDGTLPSVVVDPNQIRQVFLNMLTNAADAMDGVGTITVTTRRSEDGKSIEIGFADTGQGIDAEKLGKIFEPFYTTKPVGKGTGLGLPVSYGIVKKHGGDISVTSEVGRGTTFIVRLPVEIPVEESGG